MTAPPVLQTRSLGCTIGGAVIVSDVDLSIERGELLGIIGPNGAGKTSLLNLLSGILPATSGTVTMEGRDITGWPAHRRARLGLGRTFQTSNVFPALPVAENVRLAAQAHMGGNLRLWRLTSTLADATHRVDHALESVGLAARAGEIAGLLSHGDRRKLELAILLAGEPSVILLDEPMAGMNAEDVPELTSLIAQVHREHEATVVMIEHHMDVVLELAQRIVVMHRGELMVSGTPEEVMADTTVQQAYLGSGL